MQIRHNIMQKILRQVILCEVTPKTSWNIAKMVPIIHESSRHQHIVIIAPIQNKIIPFIVHNVLSVDIQ